MSLLAKHAKTIGGRNILIFISPRNIYKFRTILISQNQQQWTNLFPNNLIHTNTITTRSITKRRKRPLLSSNNGIKNKYSFSTSNKLSDKEEIGQSDSTIDNGDNLSKQENDKTKREDNTNVKSDAESSPKQKNQQIYEGIFPPSLDDPIPPGGIEQNKKISYFRAFVNTCKLYKDTWKNEDDQKKKGQDDDDEDYIDSITGQLREKQQKVKSKAKRNAIRNIVLLRQQGKIALEKVQNETGIYTKEDLKEIVAELLKLATSCTTEFMKGYRTGRDEEINRVLNEYFKELDEKENKMKGNKRRRKIRKRDLTFLI